MKLKPKKTEFDKKLWETRIKLFSLVKRMPSYSSDWKNHRIQKILENPNILDQLKIDLPLSKIEEIFNKFGIIVLRKPKEENLLFYCGNSPIYSSAMKKHYNKESSSHKHEEYETIDCDILMNPTIVSHSLSKDLVRYLSSIDKKYKKIEGCGLCVIHDMDVMISPYIVCPCLMKKKIRALNSICDDDEGVVINAFDIQTTKNRKHINIVKKIAKKYNFTTKNTEKLIRYHNYKTNKTDQKQNVEINFHRPKSEEKIVIL
jgi:hypothetical protein